MPKHAVYCMDTPKIPEDITEATKIVGWLLCPRYIKSVRIKIPGFGFQKVTYGLPRPDVAAHFSQYPNAEHCGFSMEVPMGFMNLPHQVDIFLKVKGNTGANNYHVLRSRMKTNEIQHVEFVDEFHLTFPPSFFLEKKLKKSLESKPSIILRLDIINKCNLRCVMCHFNDDAIYKRPTRKISAEDFRHFFEGISPYVMSVMLSCGDEPLLSEHFPEIVSYLAEEHPHVEIELCTNATLMNARIRRLMVEKGVTHILLSMDGITKKTFESIRIGAKYEKVVGNILALRDLKRATGARFPMMVMDYVLMNANIHEAPLFVKLSSLMGAQAIDFRHVVPSQFFNDPDQMLCNHKSKFNHYRQQIMDEAKRYKISIFIPAAYDTTEEWTPPHDMLQVDLSDFKKVIPDKPLGEMPIPREFPQAFMPRQLKGTTAELFSTAYCHRPFSEIMIVDQEFVKPCPWFKIPLGKLSGDRTLSEIFFGDEFRSVRENMLRTKGDLNCRDCPVKAEFLPIVNEAN